MIFKSGIKIFFVFLTALVINDKCINPACAKANGAIAIKQWVKQSKVPHYSFTVVGTYPHDFHHFTEGLFLDEGDLYESSGLYGQSKLQKLDVHTGKIVREYALPASYFAEGIAVIKNNIYQLTYKEHLGFVYDKATFKLIKKFKYPTEGWGLATDGKQLIMSDGSETLFFLNPTNFNVIRELVVTDQHYYIISLNSLAYIHGKIYANIWPSDIIAIISPVTGRIEGWIDIHSLNTQSGCTAKSCVANGIAYDAKNDVILVTGKNWLHLFAIRLNR